MALSMIKFTNFGFFNTHVVCVIIGYFYVEWFSGASREIAPVMLNIVRMFSLFGKIFASVDEWPSKDAEELEDVTWAHVRVSLFGHVPLDIPNIYMNLDFENDESENISCKKTLVSSHMW